ncbi:hypothetical protein MBH78_22935 [Oceanimonas sp. NS1]|nr:hypothetical protein [Oceanimonas sp. NS1]
MQNRVSGDIYESPQFLYMLVAACLFSKYPKETRLDYVTRFYDAVSTFKNFPAHAHHVRRAHPYPPVQLLRADRVRRQPGFH